MRTGAVRPAFSCTMGAPGTSDARGGSPRVGTTRATISPELSGSQRKGVPMVAFSPAPIRRRACAVATSATHSSSPLPTAFANASERPSGDHWV